MSVFDTIFDWWKGPPPPEQAIIHKKMREVVHLSRNMATVAVSASRIAEKTANSTENTANRVCSMAHQAIRRLDGGRQESDECKD